MVRDLRGSSSHKLIATKLTTIAALAISLACQFGCGIPSDKDDQNKDGDQTKTAPSKPTEPPQAVAPQADSKPVEPPLDLSVDVDGLLAMRLSSEELSVGWIRLFDGQSMMGWRNAGDANWKVEEGALFANEGAPGLLCTSVRFSDFELMLEFKGTDTTNSGVFMRTPAVPKDPAKDCFELNIAPPDNPFPTGSLVARESKDGW